jgi:uncharacterized protein YneF (UPF0154 family)
MSDKRELYKNIKIAGLILYIPVTLLAGPLGGYFLGEFLVQKFKLANFYLVLLICIGLVTGVWESVRIIRMVLKIESKD